jgi:maleamate amidohydrolase
MTDRFAEVGYGDTPVGFGARPGIIVVDFQLGFTDPALPMGGSPHVARAVANTAVLLKSAREHRVPVACCYATWPNRRDMPYWKISTLFKGFGPGDPGIRLDPRIHDPAYDYSFPKTAPSAFFGTPLAAWFTKEQVDTVIVTGCTTSGCVRGTIIDAFSNGFRVIVPEDCCGDMDEGPHWDNLRDVGRRYADVIKSADVLRHFATLPAAKQTRHA